MFHFLFLLLLAFSFSTESPVIGAANEFKSEDLFIKRFSLFLQPLFEEVSAFQIRIKAHFDESEKDGTQKAPEQLTVFRNRNEWGICLISSWRNVAIIHTATATKIMLPDAGKVFTGFSSLTSKDLLAPEGFVKRFITSETSLYGIFAIMNGQSVETALRVLLTPRLTQQKSEIENLIEAGFDNSFRISLTGSGPLHMRISSTRKLNELWNIKLFEIDYLASPPESLPENFCEKNLESIAVSAEDLSRMVFHGLRRILTIKLPVAPVNLPDLKVDYGERRVHDDNCLVILKGSPAQIGQAHGQLLGHGIRQMIDSTIYLVGLVETLKKGKWFQDDLDQAWERLSPHISAEHHLEMMALASATPNVTLREVRFSNIFPEYFHCSGFAIFGKATTNGKLLHGRVLDYMTEIGLQSNAVAFVIVPEGKNAFFSPGFAGFVGSVGGMNTEQISIGEMGGRGRYDWDGVPMSFLVRHALEKCSSLEQVKNLWLKAPRTCEYFYVFSDGKIPDAVGVRATSKEIEFLAPGQSHFFIGEGIPDTVIMSAGDRLKLLRERITAGHGNFDFPAALKLMDRPVAMKSNLHNVLFVPASGDIYLAIATASEPAAEQKYVRFNLQEILADRH